MPGPQKGVRHGGRQKGTPNKKTLAFRELLEAKGLDVVSELKEAIENREVEMIKALTGILPYIVPRLKEAEIKPDTPPDDKPKDLSSVPTADLVRSLRGEVN